MEKQPLDLQSQYRRFTRRKILILLLLGVFVVLLFFVSLMQGSSDLSFSDSLRALFGFGEETAVRIVQKIRLPRVLTGIITGMGLALSGLIMQTCLDNPMASPSTLGVSQASVLGANVGIILLSGGVVATYHGNNWGSYNPYAVSAFAFLFSLGAIFLVLIISKIRNFSPDTLILAGIALSALFSAITTLIQYFATDTQLSSAVYWSFGDLGRASFQDVAIMSIAVLLSLFVFILLRWKLNALSQGELQARGLGVRTSLVRFIALLFSSLVTAICISFLGIIGFVGIIAPHVMRRVIGNDHRYLIPGSALSGAVILLVSDTLARVVMKGFSLPVGAVTAILGAPFFLYIIFRTRKDKA